MFCLYDTQTNTVINRWDKVPASIALPNGDQIEGAESGFSQESWVIAPYTDSDLPPTQFHSSSGETASLVDGTVVISRQWTACTLEEAKASASERLARWRLAAETAGFEFGGMLISTDRNSQNKITAAWISAKLDSAYTVPNWKVGPFTFITLDNSTIITIGDAVRTYVQQCFNAEQEKSAAVAAASTIEDVAVVMNGLEG